MQISGDTNKDSSMSNRKELQEMGDKESAADKEKVLQERNKLESLLAWGYGTYDFAPRGPGTY